MNYIKTYCRITNNQLFVNGLELDSSSEELSIWLKQLYKKYALDYPKFYKMDIYSKLALLGVEAMKLENELQNITNTDEVALVFSNSTSSYATDVLFEKSYKEEQLPSPSLFVYTLPNILIGELAIRNKLFGENMFFISSVFDASAFEEQVTLLLPQNAQECICGWVDVNEKGIDVFLFLVTAKENSAILFNTVNLEKLYKENNG